MPQYHYKPGTEIPVEVLADSNGDVAEAPEAVAIVGEGTEGPQVELVEQVSDRAVAVLKNTPEVLRDPDTDETDIASGESAGMATAVLGVHVMWMNEDSGYSATPGDYVEVGDGGDIEAYTGPTATENGTLTNTLGVASDGSLEHDGTTDAGELDIDFTQDAFPFGMVVTTVAREWGVGGKVAVALTGGK